MTVAAAHRAADLELHTAADIGVTELPCALHASHPHLPPVWITENGSAEVDTVGPDGQVHDTARIDCRTAHLAAGIDVRGYRVWSLLDNYEWAHACYCVRASPRSTPPSSGTSGPTSTG